MMLPISPKENTFPCGRSHTAPILKPQTHWLPVGRHDGAASEFVEPVLHAATDSAGLGAVCEFVCVGIVDIVGGPFAVVCGKFSNGLHNALGFGVSRGGMQREADP